jgi:hypothetical protein
MDRRKDYVRLFQVEVVSDMERRVQKRKTSSLICFEVLVWKKMV